MEKITSPLVLVHAEDDPVIPVQCSQRLFEKATTREKFFWKMPQQLGNETRFPSGPFEDWFECLSFHMKTSLEKRIKQR
ncbi:hypothetical protein EBR03_08310 [bacterium]|nr:hypothetical protein [bacterium]